ncbi:MAG: hypothetical protein ACP5D2_01190 [Candidatus Nanoarchaeia archaeon]
MIIKKIFKGEVDELVHISLLKFGKGNFENKYTLEAKKKAGRWHIKTSPEYANFFVKKCLRGNLEVKGAIISTFDLKEEIDFEFEKEKNYMGIKQILINNQIDAEKIFKLMEKYPKVFFALSFKTDNAEVKIKAKPPKSPKPAAKGQAIKNDFCNIKTSDKELLNDLFFDIDYENAGEIVIAHDINIDKIILPDNIKEMKPAEIRENSKRHGEIIRRIVVDGKKKENKAEFTA